MFAGCPKLPEASRARREPGSNLLVPGFRSLLFEYYLQSDFQIVLSQRHVSMDHLLHGGI
jgi:hypothetical protein